MLKLAYDNYTWSFPVIISFIRTNTWNIRLFQKPVGNMTSTSFPETTVEIASFGSNFTAQDKPKLWKTLKCFLKRGFETNNFTISVSHHSLWMMPKWHIWLVMDSWSLTTPIRNSAGWTKFCKIAMTLGRCNLHSLTHTPLLLFTVDHPLGTNLFLSSAFRCHKNQRWRL